MRIVFIGAVDFSRHCLQHVLASGGHVVGVVTLDRKFATFNTDYVDLSEVAEVRGVPVYKVRKTTDASTVELVRSLRPDVIFVLGWSQLLPQEILVLPPLGCIGSHPALLPRNRGRHPLIWALVEGLEESGLTFFYLDEGADSGDILWQTPFSIALEDDAGTLYEKIKALASEAVPAFLRQLESGTAPRVVQDHSKATYWRKRGEKDGEICWTSDTMTIYNLIRALTHPYVGAHTFWKDARVLIWKSQLLGDDTAPDVTPGTVFHQDEGGLYVRTGDGSLLLREWEAPREIQAGVMLGGDVCVSS
jgi:methionyl-tRNA formyltransferase